MLVLSRKRSERIQIGDRVVVTVLEIRRNKVRIGIDAPEDIHVLRTELQNHVSGASDNSARVRVVPTGSYASLGIESWESEGGACG